MNGKVYLVGAGAGDPGLITLKGMECIKNADVIIYDHLASPVLLNYASPECELIYAGKTAGKHHLIQEEINRLMAEYAAADKNTVRLKGGDPFVFGRGGEEAEYLREHKADFEIVPGVSSCYSVPAYSGIPVTHRDCAPAFHVVTGHNKDGGIGEDYSALSKMHGTLVFLMGINNIENITAQLIENGMESDTPSAVISQGTTGQQRTVTAPLCEIAAAVKKARLPLPGIIVVGEAVNLNSKIAWQKEGGLRGIRILATGTQNTMPALRKAVERYNGELTEISLIRTVPINENEFSKLDLSSYTHIVLFSGNGAEVFFEYIKRHRIDIRTLTGIRFAVTGKKCARALEEHGIYADIVPEIYNSKELSRCLEKELCEDSRVLVLRAENTDNAVSEMLKKKRVSYTDMAIYRTEEDARKRELLNICGSFDYIIIMSGSAARALKNMYDGEICSKIISIGAQTTAAAKAAGLKIYKTADTADAEGIVKAITEG